MNAGKRMFGLGYMEEGKEVDGVEFDGSVTKQFLSVADLARKDPRVLRKKSQLYLWNLLTVAVFYSLPVVQLVLTYQLGAWACEQRRSGGMVGGASLAAGIRELESDCAPSNSLSRKKFLKSLQVLDEN
uniref:Uncharacterized protein n=1 Tax=Timema cristinae TaxID=61476 RepID=A0A7R9CW01_TIMCR|nr:unnamed protein product [Timema cristinae]